MADPYPKSYDDLVAENTNLRSEVARLQSALGSAQAVVVARDAEMMRIQKPRPAPRILSADAPDKFRRPAYRR